MLSSQAQLKQVHTEFSGPGLSQKHETGKLNENQQLTTLDRDVGSKLTNQKSVVFPERSSS